MKADPLEPLLRSHPERWIEALPRFQQTLTKQMLSEGRTHDDVASAWLTAQPDLIRPFSAGPAKILYAEKFMEELEAFICGDAKYEQERNDLLNAHNVTHTLVISSISVAIASAIGASAAVVAPAVAVTFVSIATVSRNAWCAARKAARSDNGARER